MLKKYDSAVSQFILTAEMNECSEDTLANYARICRLFREFLAENGYEEPNMEATLNWRKSLEGRKVTTIDLYLRVLQYLSDFAVEMNIFEESFVSKKLLPKRKQLSKEKNQPYEHVLTDEDAMKLLTATRCVNTRTPHTFKRDSAIVALLILSGLRNSELRALTMNDLYFEEGAIHVVNGKGGKERYVPFVAAAQEKVKIYLESGLRPENLPDDALLFGRMSKNGVWEEIDRTALSHMVFSFTKSILGEEKASRSHSMRHCFASRCWSNGMTLESIGEILGHSQVQTTRIYAEKLDKKRFAADFGKEMVAVMQKKEVSA